MTRRFNAACVSVEEDSDRWLVAFADAEFNAARYLLLQRAKSPGADDVELGLDGYQVEVDDPGNACYGGIVSCELFSDRVVVAFDEETAAILDGETAMEVEFALRPRQLDQLRDGLARVFAGDACFLDLCG